MFLVIMVFKCCYGLALDSDFIEFEAKKKAIKVPEALKKKK